MADFASSDVTVVITRRYVSHGVRHCQGTLTFGDASITYAAGGVPLPAFQSFGFIRNMDTLHIMGVNGLTSDYVVKFDKANHKLQLFEEEGTAAGGPLLEADTNEAPAARTYYWTAEGW